MAAHGTPLSSFTSIRISHDQRAQLQELAAANHRTIAGEIRHMLDLYLDDLRVAAARSLVEAQNDER